MHDVTAAAAKPNRVEGGRVHLGSTRLTIISYLSYHLRQALPLFYINRPLLLNNCALVRVNKISLFHLFYLRCNVLQGPSNRDSRHPACLLDSSGRHAYHPWARLRLQRR